MEIQHEDIQLVSSCSVCGDDQQQNKDRNQYRQYGPPTQQQRNLQQLATGSTSISTLNIVLIVLIVLILLGGIFLIRRKPAGRRR